MGKDQACNFLWGFHCTKLIYNEIYHITAGSLHSFLQAMEKVSKRKCTTQEKNLIKTGSSMSVIIGRAKSCDFHVKVMWCKNIYIYCIYICKSILTLMIVLITHWSCQRLRLLRRNHCSLTFSTACSLRNRETERERERERLLWASCFSLEGDGSTPDVSGGGGGHSESGPHHVGGWRAWSGLGMTVLYNRWFWHITIECLARKLRWGGYDITGGSTTNEGVLDWLWMTPLWAWCLNIECKLNTMKARTCSYNDQQKELRKTCFVSSNVA